MYLPVPMINSGVVFLSDLWSGQVKAILNQSENVLPLHTSIQDDADPVLLIHMVSLPEKPVSRNRPAQGPP